MKVSDFAVFVARREGGKKQISIAQIKEVMRIINVMTYGMLYKFIRNI